MTSENAYILDVGHGNCTILQADGKTVVVDAPKGTVLNDALAQLGVTEIEAIFVSHADADHVVGISTLLLNKAIKIGTVYVSADAEKSTKAWQQFRSAVAEASTRGTSFTSANTTFPKNFSIGALEICILSPYPDNAVAGPGAKDNNGTTITSNSISTVIKVCFEGSPRLLLCGDMEGTSLETMISRGSSMQAPVLVFPHHGGLPGDANVGKFTEKLCTVVQPALVIFSNSRDGQYDNPRPEVIQAVTPFKCKVACTQLSKSCRANNSDLKLSHLSTLAAKGALTNSSCAGSIVFDLRNFDASLHAHVSFIDNNVPAGLCRHLNCASPPPAQAA